VVPALGQAVFRAVHLAQSHGLVRSCHDLSEGGLAVALAEMAFAGGLGASVSLRDVPCEDDAAHDLVLLFAESPSRFLLEVPPQNYAAFADLVGSLPMGRLGEVMPSEGPAGTRLSVTGLDRTTVIDAHVDDLKMAWQKPLDW
jgi:phosphoribosylformylglycinamidine synthase